MKRKNFADIFILSALIALGALFIIRRDEVSKAVTEALKSCVYVIIPSLFAMTAVSTAISKSGVISKLTGRLHADGNVLTAFIFGNIGGYPVGVKLLSEMAADGRISEEKAAKAMVFCFGCGPAFAAGAAGSAIFGDIRFGLAAFGAAFLTNLTFYILFLLNDKEMTPGSFACEGFSTKLMTESVRSAADAMYGVCTMIVFFAALKAVLLSLAPTLAGAKLLAPVLEISNISVCKDISLVTASMLLCFGGICVQAQVLAIIDGAFSVKRFYLSRLFAIPLCGFYAILAEKLLYHLGVASAAATKIRLSRSPSLIPVFCVLAMVFITVLEDRRKA